MIFKKIYNFCAILILEKKYRKFLLNIAVHLLNFYHRKDEKNENHRYRN